MSEENKKNMHVDIELVRQLAAVLDETNLTEIEVEDGDRKVRVARKVSAAPVAYAAPPVAAAPLAAAAPVSMPSDPASITPAHENAVKSPMVGTAYLAAEPGAKPFIAVGSQIKAGDTLV
ncbi:MAG TPA: acetyl-CoA carboxylase, biotin carboxyl carrier protein, partial [Sphingomonas sp.]|nr:acetyl-CoA carboxylase, biotin carboxyl carrier protein [Sphingomonas sp.]